MAEQAGRLFRGLISKDKEGYHCLPVPPSSDNASVAASADDNVGGDRRRGFRGSTLDLSPHAAYAAFKSCQRWQQHGSYVNDGNPIACDGNNIEDGGGKSVR